MQFYKGAADWTAVAAVKAATRLPVIVNGDIVDVASAREALELSGADAVMIGRGLYGQPWLPAQVEAALSGAAVPAGPEAEVRFAIVMEHLQGSLDFYGERLGLKIFRKHLGWYVQRAPWPANPETRRQAKADICRLESALQIEYALRDLWLGAVREAPSLAA